MKSAHHDHQVDYVTIMPFEFDQFANECKYRNHYLGRSAHHIANISRSFAWMFMSFLARTGNEAEYKLFQVEKLVDRVRHQHVKFVHKYFPNQYVLPNENGPLQTSGSNDSGNEKLLDCFKNSANNTKVDD